MNENDDLDLELDLTDTSADDLEGNSNVPPGKYHARIDEVKRVSDMNSYLRVKFALLAGTSPAGVGHTLTERFYLTEKARKRINAFASRMKLVDATSLGNRVTVSFADLIGRQLIIEVIEDEYETKSGGKAKSSKLGFATFWSLDDPRVADVPRAKAQQAAPPKSKKPKSTGDEWEGL